MQHFHINDGSEPQPQTTSHLTDGLENVSFIAGQFNGNTFYVAVEEVEPFTLSVRFV